MEGSNARARAALQLNQQRSAYRSNARANVARQNVNVMGMANMYNGNPAIDCHQRVPAGLAHGDQSIATQVILGQYIEARPTHAHSTAVPTTQVHAYISPRKERAHNSDQVIRNLNPAPTSPEPYSSAEAGCGLEFDDAQTFDLKLEANDAANPQSRLFDFMGQASEHNTPTLGNNGTPPTYPPQSPVAASQAVPTMHGALITLPNVEFTQNMFGYDTDASLGQLDGGRPPIHMTSWQHDASRASSRSGSVQPPPRHDASHGSPPVSSPTASLHEQYSKIENSVGSSFSAPAEQQQSSNAWCAQAANSCRSTPQGLGSNMSHIQMAHTPEYLNVEARSWTPHAASSSPTNNPPSVSGGMATADVWSSALTIAKADEITITPRRKSSTTPITPPKQAPVSLSTKPSSPTDHHQIVTSQQRREESTQTKDSEFETLLMRLQGFLQNAGTAPKR